MSPYPLHERFIFASGLIVMGIIAFFAPERVHTALWRFFVEDTDVDATVHYYPPPERTPVKTSLDDPRGLHTHNGMEDRSHLIEFDDGEDDD